MERKMLVVIEYINEYGFPVVAVVGMGWFIWFIYNYITEKIASKLDNANKVLIALIDRIRSLDNEIIRQDTLIKTILGVPQLIDSNKIAKADRDDQRKD